MLFNAYPSASKNLYYCALNSNGQNTSQSFFYQLKIDEIFINSGVWPLKFCLVSLVLI